jgi:K+-transporting ATPase ATPase A chain
MVKDERQGWALYAVMSILFLAGVLVCYWAEGSGNPQFAALGLDPGNMEGKEVRFGLAQLQPRTPRTALSMRCMTASRRLVG